MNQQMTFEGFEEKDKYKYDIYLSSSHSNPYLSETFNFFKKEGINVYDFRKNLIAWENVFRGLSFTEWNWKNFSIHIGTSNKAKEVLYQDYEAIKSSMIFLLMMPCGNDCHAQLGYAIANNIPIVIYNQDGVIPCYDFTGKPGPWKPSLYYASTPFHISKITEIIRIIRLINHK